MSRCVLTIKKGISLQNLVILTYLLSVICSWSYGNSYILYVLLSVGFAIFAYGKFLVKVVQGCSRIEFMLIILLFITFLTSLLNSGLKSMIMVNISLLIPFAFSYLNIDYSNLKRQIVFAALADFLIVVLLFVDKQGWNSNSLAFMVFSGISIGFIWFKMESRIKLKVCAAVYLIVASGVLLSAGSRNAGIVIAMCMILLIIPNRFMKNKWFFRFIYISVMLATIFASDVMTYVFNNEEIMTKLVEYTSGYSDKAWAMDTHLTILLEVKQKFSELGVFTQLIGEGVKSHHTHNLFYQCLYFYGYLGTILLYGIYVVIFEIGYKLFKKYNNTLALGCSIILVGHFMMQIGEVYMWGSETAIIISLLPAGLILQQNRQEKLL